MILECNDSLLWDIESTSELDFERATTSLDCNGPCSEFIYLVGTNYKGHIGSKLTFVYKGVLVTTQDCTRISEQGL